MNPPLFLDAEKEELRNEVYSYTQDTHSAYMQDYELQLFIFSFTLLRVSSSKEDVELVV